MDVQESALALLETGVLLVDDIQASLASYNDAVGAALLDGGFYFHRSGCSS